MKNSAELVWSKWRYKPLNLAIMILFSAHNLALAGFPLTKAVGENIHVAFKTCCYAFVAQQLFSISSQN